MFARVFKPAGRFVSGATLIAAAGTTLALLPAPAASAAATVSVSPTSATNAAVKKLTFTTHDSWLVNQPPTVRMSRSGTNGADPLTVTNEAVTGTVSGSTVTADVDLRLANPGTYDVTVTGTAAGPPPAPNTQDGCQACFTVTDAAPLTVSGASPDKIQLADANGTSSGKFVVSGTGFVKGSVLSVVDNTNTPVNGVTVSDTSPATATTAQTITKIITVGPSVASGPYNLMVTDSDASQVCTGCLTVDPAMRVDSVTPPTLQVGSSGQTVTIAGANFASDAAVTFKPSSGSGTSGVSIGSQSVSADHSTITLNNVSVSSTAAAQDLNVVITSASESVTDTFKGEFKTVAGPQPTGVTYNDSSKQDYGQGAQSVRLTVSGTNFDAGTQVTISPIGGVTINKETTTVSGGSGSVEVNLSLDSTAPTGTRTLTVTNSDGSSTTCDNHTNVSPNTCVLTIAPAPAVASISPPSLSEGQEGTITIDGSGFDASTGVNITDATVKSVSFVSPTRITADVQALTTPGQKNVTLSNASDKGVSTCPNCFNIDSLIVSSVTPTTHDNSGDVTLDIKGSNFDPATVAVKLQLPATSTHSEIDVLGNTQPGATASEFTAVVPLKGVDPSPDYRVVVTNSGTKPGTGTANTLFNVTDVNSGPSISGVKPSSAASGSSGQSVEIDGADFYPHSSVSFSFPANGGGNVTVKSVSYVNSGKLTVVIDVAGGVTTTQNGTVTVTNTDTKSASSAFAITPAPTMSKVSPASQPVNATQFTMTFGANNAQTGATVDFPGATFLHAGPTAITGADASTPAGFNQKVTTVVTVGPNAQTGTYDVRLTNPDNGTGSCVKCFTLAAVPPGAPTGVSGTPGNQQVTVSWTAPNNNGSRIDHYTITASPGGSKTTVSAPDANSAAPTSGTVTGLTNGTAYTFTVTAHNAGGDGPASAASAPVTPVAPTNPPTNVTATAGDTKATVTWTAPTPAQGDSIKDYIVRTNPNGPTVNAAANATTADVTGLTNGTTYTFTVVVEYTSKATADSTPSNSVTPFGKPAAPTNVTASSSDGQTVTVSWTASNNNGATIDTYTVTASPGGKTVTVTGSGSSAPATTATFTGLSAGTYTFTVVAHNKAGSSPASTTSNSVTLTTPAPTTLTLASTAGHLVAGHGVTLGGSLTDGSGTRVGGATVTVTARLDGGQTLTVGSTTTASDGTWTVFIRPTHNATYTASYAGNAQYAKATSPSGRITVAPKVTIAARAVTNHANVLVVSGSVSPNKHGRTVRLTAVRSNGVRRTFSVTLTGRSTYKFKVKLGKGKWRLVVHIGSTRGNTAGHSAAKTIKRT